MCRAGIFSSSFTLFNPCTLSRYFSHSSLNFATSITQQLIHPMTIPLPLLVAQHRLVQQLQAQSVPNVCVFLLIYWIGHVRHAHRSTKDSPNDRKMAQWVIKMLDLVWEWVTRPRSDKKRHGLAGMVCLCSPDEQSMPDHVHGRDTITKSQSTPGRFFVNECLIAGVEIDCADIVPLNQLNRRKRWPRSLHGLFPHGADATVQGLCQWLGHKRILNDQSQILNSLHNMITIVHALVIPKLIVCKPFLYVINRMAWGCPPSLVSRIKDSKHKKRDDILKRMLAEYDQIIVVLRLAIDQASSIERQIFHRNSSNRLYAAYEDAFTLFELISFFIRQDKYEGFQDSSQERLITGSPVSRCSRVRDNVVALARKLCTDCPQLDFQALFTSKRPELCDTSLEVVLPDPPPTNMQVITEWLAHPIESRPRCLAPSCFRTMAERPLKLCTGCHSVLYCSRRCQKRAWTHADVGHRFWCSALANLDRAHDSPSEPDSNAHHGLSIECGFSPDDQEVMARRVLDYIEKLVLMKLQALDPDVKLQTPGQIQEPPDVA
jgi:hypothetical protein